MMLCLSRKLGQKIRLGKQGEIVIEVVRIQGDKITLGVSAPPEVPAHREEVYQRIQQQKVA